MHGKGGYLKGRMYLRGKHLHGCGRFHSYRGFRRTTCGSSDLLAVFEVVAVKMEEPLLNLCAQRKRT